LYTYPLLRICQQVFSWLTMNQYCIFLIWLTKASMTIHYDENHFTHQ
jgi:hypothetical protein